MLSFNEYVNLKAIAERAFEYCKQRILHYINPVLEVDYADTVNYTFANIRRPNMVFIHLDNVAAEYPIDIGYKRVSLIFIAIAHEMFHLEQVMSQELYRMDTVYKITIEKSVEQKTYEFLKANKKEIDRLFGINLDLSYLKNQMAKNHYKDWSGFYQSANVEQIYKNTIMNVIFRKDISFNYFCEEVLNKYDNISIAFENGPNLLIKSNGEFCDQNLNAFISAVGAAAGRFDRYTVGINVIESPYRDKELIANVIFTLSNRSIYPMVFRGLETR